MTRTLIFGVDRPFGLTSLVQGPTNQLITGVRSELDSGSDGAPSFHVRADKSTDTDPRDNECRH